MSQLIVSSHLIWLNSFCFYLSHLILSDSLPHRLLIFLSSPYLNLILLQLIWSHFAFHPIKSFPTLSASDLTHPVTSSHPASPCFMTTSHLLPPSHLIRLLISFTLLLRGLILFLRIHKQVGRIKMMGGGIKMTNERPDWASVQTDGEPRTNCPGTCEPMRKRERLWELCAH